LYPGLPPRFPHRDTIGHIVVLGWPLFLVRPREISPNGGVDWSDLKATVTDTFEQVAVDLPPNFLDHWDLTLQLPLPQKADGTVMTASFVVSPTVGTDYTGVVRPVYSADRTSMPMVPVGTGRRRAAQLEISGSGTICLEVLNNYSSDLRRLVRRRTSGLSG
jgi:hypothetical protein